MSQIDYSKAQYPIRQSFADGHNRYWKKLASPGSWFTGTERVAIAKEVRQASDCSLCKQRKTALSPYQVDGSHTHRTDLPDVVIEVIHRITTDPGRLTKTWFDGIMQQGLSPEKYVEILGTLVCVYSIDEFCRGMSLPLNELPQPLPGKPDNYRPAKVFDQGAWVQMMPPAVSSGPEVDILGERKGNVIRALSLVPDQVRHMLDLLEVHYLDISQIWNVTGSYRGTLSRIQMEVVAARVSALNSCFY